MIKSNIELFNWIKGFEGRYQISTFGNAISVDRYVIDRNGRKLHFKGKKLKTIINNSGYEILSIHTKEGYFYNSIHRLVAEAFIPNPNNLPCVNHKDEVKTNNRVENLEWCTQKYNNNYGNHNERMKNVLTNRKDMSKKVYQYDLEGNLIKEWPSTRECGRNGFSSHYVSHCCLGKIKTYKGYIWSYEFINNFNINNYLSDKNNFNKVYQYDLKGNLIKEWLNIKEASNNGYFYSDILKCCKGKQKIHKGYIWSYEIIEDFDVNNYMYKKNNKHSKEVYQYDKYNNLIRIWPSTRECGRNGFSCSSVSECCLGKLKTHKGYIWSYYKIK